MKNELASLVNRADQMEERISDPEGRNQEIIQVKARKLRVKNKSTP